MTKKITITVGSLILFVYMVFFGDYFDLNFTEDQSETLLFLFKVYSKRKDEFIHPLQNAAEPFQIKLKTWRRP